MKTIEERKEIAIERLMEYTNTQSYEDCWYKLDMILRIMAGWDIIHNYDSVLLNKFMFKETEFDLDRMKW